jgi:hypothetical protein
MSEFGCVRIQNTANYRSIDLSRLVDVLLEHLSHSSVQTRVAVLKWVHHLHACMPDKVGSISAEVRSELTCFIGVQIHGSAISGSVENHLRHI